MDGSMDGERECRREVDGRERRTIYQHNHERNNYTVGACVYVVRCRGGGVQERNSKADKLNHLCRITVRICICVCTL